MASHSRRPRMLKDLLENMEEKGSNSTEYRAKTAYQDEKEVRTYDSVRFKNLKGRITDWLEKCAVRRALVAVPQGSRVLDIPCGTGRITALLLKQGYKTVGADISEGMLAIAEKTLKGFDNLESLERADAESLPYKDCEFEAVTSIRFMNHLPPEVRVKVLKEMARVSRSAVIVSYCNPRSLSGIKRRIKYILKPPHAPWNPATYGQVKREAADAGLYIAAVFPILGLISETNVYLLRKANRNG